MMFFFAKQDGLDIRRVFLGFLEGLPCVCCWSGSFSCLRPYIRTFLRVICQFVVGFLKLKSYGWFRMSGKQWPLNPCVFF